MSKPEVLASEIKVVEATQGDVAGIVDLRRATWLDTYPNENYGISRADIETKITSLSREEAIEREKNNLQNQDLKTWVAKAGRKVVGWCIVRLGEERNKMGALYILPEYQRQGIGSLLMKPAMAFLGDQKDIWLGVVEYNHKAINFYKKYGFELTRNIQEDVTKLPSGKQMPEVEMVRKAGYGS